MPKYCLLKVLEIRAVFECRIGTCRHVWSVDYPHVVDPTSRDIRRFYRVDVVTGRRVYPGDKPDTSCPACGKTTAKFEAVKGEFSSAHKCTESCWSAKGSDCRCACGGRNHAISRRLYCVGDERELTIAEHGELLGMDSRAAYEAERQAERDARNARREAKSNAEVTLDLFSWAITTDAPEPAAPHPVEKLFDARASPERPEPVDTGLW